MLPSYEDVQNLKQLILLSQDSRTAQQILLDLLSPCMAELEHGFCYPQLVIKILSIIQVHCEFGLSWQEQFSTCFKLIHTEGLYEQFMAQVNLQAMQCHPTKQSLSQLIQWNPCRKNPLLPTKQEVVQVVYLLCHTISTKPCIYHFNDEQHSYCLYWQNNRWYWKDCYKQLTWLID